uniref:Uncharacterized protein n=1 Tax=Trichogramma kaykai TaxID=54128 RepID=A0ABD2XCG8_9HYME
MDVYNRKKKSRDWSRVKKKAEEENRRIIAPGFIIYKQNSRVRIPRCLIRYARLAMWIAASRNENDIHCRIHTACTRRFFCIALYAPRHALQNRFFSFLPT